MSEQQPPSRRPVPQQTAPKRSLLLPLLLVGGLLGFFLLIGVVLVVLVMAFPSESKTRVTRGSVLLMNVGGLIPEYTVPGPFDLFLEKTQPAFHDYLSALDRARSDQRIEGVLLQLSPGIGWAQAEELRTALATFRERGKWVVAYGDYWTETEYFLASVADDVIMVPDSALQLDGLRARTSYYGDLLRKHGVAVHVEAFGEYKSYADTYRRTEMSDYARDATQALLLRFEETFLDGVADSRGIPRQEIKQILDEAIYQSGEGKDRNLLDAEYYADELEQHLATRLTLDSVDDLNMVPVTGYKASSDSGFGDTIAVVYGSGSIQGGNGRRGLFGDETLSSGDFIKDLRAARKNKRVKAIVLRIDSPGGSLLASDVMWREIRLAREDGIPVYASMGNSAASGGYYMAMACDRIFANPTTITGSIGVVTMKMSFGDLYRKFDVGVDVVKTSPGADMMDDHRNFTEEEAAGLRRRTRESYEVFVKKAAEARGVSFDTLDKAARGRVWSGRDALELGLVDQLGGLETTVAAVADKAGLSNYSVIRYPLGESYFSSLSQSELPLSESGMSVLSRFIPPELRFFGNLVAREEGPRWHTLAISPYHLTID